jgi:cupin superfamily acireductone dioxygenase involved in methionine salvage
MSGHIDVFCLAAESTEVTENLFVFISEAKRTKNEYRRLLRGQMLFGLLTF